MGIGGEVRVLKPGDMYIIPGDVEHYAQGQGTRAVALDIFSPVREEFNTRCGLEILRHRHHQVPHVRVVRFDVPR